MFREGERKIEDLQLPVPEKTPQERREVPKVVKPKPMSAAHRRARQEHMEEPHEGGRYVIPEDVEGADKRNKPESGQKAT